MRRLTIAALGLSVVCAAVVVAPPALADNAVTCELDGDVSFGSPPETLPTGMTMTFTGSGSVCAGDTLAASSANLAGSFSCTTGTGTGTLDLTWSGGDTSTADVTVATATTGLAAVGFISSGAYEGWTASLNLSTTEAYTFSCLDSTITSLRATGALSLSANGVASATGAVDTATDTATAISVADLPEETAEDAVEPTRSPLHKCEYPGDMYRGGATTGSGHCKYAQAWSAVKCVDSRPSTTGATCYAKSFREFAYRGGTSNTRYAGGKSCYLGNATDTRSWRLSAFAVVNRSTNQLRYSAPTTHYGWHTNCGVENQRFYGRPTPFTMTQSHFIHYTFVHSACPSSACGTFVNEIEFQVNVPS